MRVVLCVAMAQKLGQTTSRDIS
ncbi:hypothetical protein Pcinc_009838, partial [Petrolisthes cinctipes]